MVLFSVVNFVFTKSKDRKVADRAIIDQLQQQIIGLQGHKSAGEAHLTPLGLGTLERAFPGGIFPRGVIHELISTSSEQAGCTSGFLSVVLSKLMQQGGSCLWISTVPRRSIFPPALKAFGVDPERVIFLDAKTPKETLWAVEEALKCSAVPAVVGELSELSFNDSRRLQLAAEQSQVSGFIHRFRPKSENAVACVSRWKITPLPSELPNAKPGPGFPRWNIDLLKVRNGTPGSWQVQWSGMELDYMQPAVIKPQTSFDYAQDDKRQTG